MMSGSPPPDATQVDMATKQHMDRGGAVLFLAEAVVALAYSRIADWRIFGFAPFRPKIRQSAIRL